MASSDFHCYCEVAVKDDYMICCEGCKRYFHTGCLKAGRPTSLLGDTFFKFFCESCSSTGSEVCDRLKLQWTQVLLLALYNLQFQGGGKCGFFRWREHVCAFVDRHWTTFFGNKKKTNTWHGTVAGTLSGGCPHFFKSGTADLGETGWWALAVSKIPAVEEFESQSVAKLNRKQKQPALPSEQIMPVEGLRHRKHKNAVLAAMELKEKRSTLQEVKTVRRAKPTAASLKSEQLTQLDEPSCSKQTVDSLDVTTVDTLKQDVSSEIPEGSDDVFLEMEFEVAQENNFGMLESNKFSPESPPINELWSAFSSQVLPDLPNEFESTNGESSSASSRSASRMEESTDGDEEEEQTQQPSPVCRKRKIKQEEIPGEDNEQPKCILMTVYEEHELLKRLEKLRSVVEKHPVARSLRRKLLVRQAINKKMKGRLTGYSAYVSEFMRLHADKDASFYTNCAVAARNWVALTDQDKEKYNATGKMQCNTGSSECTLETTFPCDACGKRFPKKRFLEGHKETDCKILCPRIVCAICSKSFSTKNVLQRHIRRIHFQIRKKTCSKCEKPFFRNFDLKRHESVCTL